LWLIAEIFFSAFFMEDFPLRISDNGFMKRFSITIFFIVLIAAIGLALLSHTTSGKELRPLYVPKKEITHSLPRLSSKNCN
jgi:hypothetical protein